MTENELSVRFKPSRAIGMPDVHEIVVHPDRLEVNSGAQWIAFPFDTMGDSPELSLIALLKRALGMSPRARIVGERDHGRPPLDRHFTWYTNPRLTVYMPHDEGIDYASSYFPRIHRVMDWGQRYCTIDLS